MNKDGLSIIEVLSALVIIGLLLATFAMNLSSTFTITENTGSQGQVSQLLNQTGRKIISAEPGFLTTKDSPLEWDYKKFSEAFPNMDFDVSKYRATIVNEGPISISQTSLQQYTVTICFKEETEHCSSITTFGLGPGGSGSTPPTIEGIL